MPELLKSRDADSSDQRNGLAHGPGRLHWIAADSEAEARDWAASYGYVSRSTWAGPGHYRSDVYIVQTKNMNNLYADWRADRMTDAAYREILAEHGLRKGHDGRAVEA
jgi:hypothetical protein